MLAMLNNEGRDRDVEGYLLDPENWNEEVAQQLAAEESIVLTDDYWVILQYMRDYWAKHQIAPDVRHVMSFLAETSAGDKKTAKRKIFTLFPHGYVKQACKIAGMRKPRAWSTG